MKRKRFSVEQVVAVLKPAKEQLRLRSSLPKRRKMVVLRRERVRPRAANG